MVAGALLGDVGDVGGEDMVVGALLVFGSYILTCAIDTRISRSIIPLFGPKVDSQ